MLKLLALVVLVHPGLAHAASPPASIRSGNTQRFDVRRKHPREQGMMRAFHRGLAPRTFSLNKWGTCCAGLANCRQDTIAVRKTAQGPTVGHLRPCASLVAATPREAGSTAIASSPPSEVMQPKVLCSIGPSLPEGTPAVVVAARCIGQLAKAPSRRSSSHPRKRRARRSTVIMTPSASSSHRNAQAALSRTPKLARLIQPEDQHPASPILNDRRRGGCGGRRHAAAEA